MIKIDKGLKIYLSILIVSWILIIVYLIHFENKNQIERQLESYPYNHSQITDSTLKSK